MNPDARADAHGVAEPPTDPVRFGGPVPDDFWSDRFHWCALAASFLAVADGRLDDSEYVRRLAHDLYKSGAFRDRVCGPATLDSADEVR